MAPKLRTQDSSLAKKKAREIIDLNIVITYVCTSQHEGLVSTPYLGTLLGYPHSIERGCLLRSSKCGQCASEYSLA